MKNIFLHELGRVRDNLTPELEAGMASSQIGSWEQHSGMSGEFPPQIEPLDMMNAKALYNFPGGQKNQWSISQRLHS
jgi:hypothetical protein